MTVTYPLRLELDKKQKLPPIHVAAEDSCTRVLELSLYSGGEALAVPEAASVLVRYSKADGTGGCYDTLPDGSIAWSAAGNVLTVILAPQVCTAEGPVQLAVSLVQGDRLLSTFSVDILVQGLPGGDETSESYHYVTAFMPQPQDGAQVGKCLAVKTVDEHGRVLSLCTLEPEAGEDGGYYIPEVEQISESIIAISFTASKNTMKPNMAAYPLTLPAGVTPVRGVDYFTQEDQAAMVAAVAAALPKYDGEVVG